MIAAQPDAGLVAAARAKAERATWGQPKAERTTAAQAIAGRMTADQPGAARVAAARAAAAQGQAVPTATVRPDVIRTAAEGAAGRPARARRRRCWQHLAQSRARRGHGQPPCPRDLGRARYRRPRPGRCPHSGRCPPLGQRPRPTRTLPRGRGPLPGRRSRPGRCPRPGRRPPLDECPRLDQCPRRGRSPHPAPLRPTARPWLPDNRPASPYPRPFAGLDAHPGQSHCRAVLRHLRHCPLADRRRLRHCPQTSRRPRHWQLASRCPRARWGLNRGPTHPAARPRRPRSQPSRAHPRPGQRPGETDRPYLRHSPPRRCPGLAGRSRPSHIRSPRRDQRHRQNQ